MKQNITPLLHRDVTLPLQAALAGGVMCPHAVAVKPLSSSSSAKSDQQNNPNEWMQQHHLLPSWNTLYRANRFVKAATRCATSLTSMVFVG